MWGRRTLLMWASTLALSASPVLAQTAGTAIEMAGARYETTAQVGGSNLLLNGMGVRYKAVIIKVYAAGLYLGTKATTPAAVMAAPGPKRMHIVMLRDIDANELGKLFTQGMEKNSSREDFTKSINGTVRLAELFVRKKRLKAGDSFSVDWLPDKGTVVLVNGMQEIEPIREPEFFNTLLSIWLGKQPADSQLKSALLGLPAAN